MFTNKEGKTYTVTNENVSMERVLSIRVEETLYNLLEGLTEKWGSRNVSSTVRTLISMYFIPEVYRVEWETIKPEELGSSMDLKSYEEFIQETTEYMSFLREAVERSKYSTNELEVMQSKVEGIFKEMKDKMESVLVEQTTRL